MISKIAYHPHAHASTLRSPRADDEDGDMDMDEDMDTEMDAVEDDAQPPPPSAPDLDAPINIVKDYQKPGFVPTTGNDAVKFMISPITGQQIPVDQVTVSSR